LPRQCVPNYDDRNSVFSGYGRVIRDRDGSVHKIIEFKDASDDERKILEVNPSYYCFDAKWLWQNISKLQNKNAAHEFYLTDIVQLARDQNKKVVASQISNIDECLGINTPEQLKMVEEIIGE
jgi:bifunctional N-acetylglucosamine-1-phosphate-uridyltransferase/glucosamine-1-phosphate-acetyltransferase GlmU-like protein